MEDRLIVSVSGVRGTVGRTLTPAVACDFGCAFATMLGEGKTVVIGRDTGGPGAMIRNAVAAGLMGCGINVIDLGVVTTPGVSLMTRHLKADGGAMITASHNPIEYNGIKFLQPSGTGLRASDAARLKEIWQGKKFNLATADRQASESHDSTTHERHVDAVCTVVDAKAIAAKKFKVVLDSINGAGCVVSPMLMARLDCQLVHINATPDGRFAHPPEPLRQNLTGLCEEVRRTGAAVGFAQDPDADRLVVIDENGNYIGEEYTLAMATAFVLSRHKGKVATNLSTSRMIDDVAASFGCSVVRSPTGEANVVEAMERNGCIFGGEGVGGVIEPKVTPVRNSLVGMAYILQYMAQTGKTISQLAAQIPHYEMMQVKVACPPELAASVAKEVRRMYEGRPDAKFNEDDGLRVDMPDGWLLVRASNTEPIMRITAEAGDRRKAQELLNQACQAADKLTGKKTC